ncbi:hypothetical protein C8Q77DRAFT_1052473 [Trametes polyzona]|nr:hypothetical protein C8Q77DRAFT_1052473 [Trametes polyzona]
MGILPDDSLVSAQPFRLSKPTESDNGFRSTSPFLQSRSDTFQVSPEELVDRALHALQTAGIQLIEWKSLLYRRMGVPVFIKDYHYLVPDEEIEHASTIVQDDQGLPPSIPPSLLLRTGGDFYAKARMFRVTRSTSLASAQHLVLYPASLASFTPSELEPQARLTSLSNPLCKTVLVPSPPAVYASLLRLMRTYTRFDPTRVMLESDLSELIGYNLYGLEDGFVDTDDDELCEELEVDEKVEEATRAVRVWRYNNDLRDEDGWIADTLADVVAGKLTVEDIPFAEKVPGT